MKGKLVLGQGASKTALAKAGALGVISENTENRDLRDERGWVNSFGDNGWSFTKGSAPLVSFSIPLRRSLSPTCHGYNLCDGSPVHLGLGPAA